MHIQVQGVQYGQVIKGPSLIAANGRKFTFLLQTIINGDIGKGTISLPFFPPQFIVEFELE